MKKRRSIYGRRRISGSLKAYIAFTLLTLALCGAFLIYVASVVKEFDSSRPETQIEGELDVLAEKLKDGGVEKYMDVSSTYSKYYGKPKEEYINNYNEFLKRADRLEYNVVTGAGEGLEKVYRLTANGSPFAEVRLSGENDRTKLFFFSMADWHVSSVAALPFYGGKELELYVPKGVTCRVNGEIVDGAHDVGPNGVPKYTLRSLPDNVVVSYERSDGTAIGYYRENDVITPKVCDYSLTLPNDVSVFVDGAQLSGTPEGDGMRYEIISMLEPNVELRDVFGHRRVYHGESDIAMASFVVELPENFELSAGGRAIPKTLAERVPNPASEELAKYAPDVTLPDVLTYRPVSFGESVSVEITDNLGNVISRELRSGITLSINAQTGEGELPKELASEVDPMRFAVDWSKFMTNDESFENIARYFPKGSQCYREAVRWANGIDRTFTSAHDFPKFSNKVMSDYVRLTEDCFSVRVKLTKSMYLVKAHQTVTDDMDMLVYFVRNKNAEGERWLVAVKHDA